VFYKHIGKSFVFSRFIQEYTMASVAFDICWKLNQSKTLEGQNDQKVGDMINQLILQLKLPEFDGKGQRISYSLYRDNQGERAQIQESLTLAQAHISGEKVYIANRSDPWWNKLSPSKDVTGKLSIDRPPAGSNKPRPGNSNPLNLSKSYACRLHLAQNCIVHVPGDRIELSRNYLSETLPSAIMMSEKARIFSGYNSRLLHVSRSCHCEIFRQNEQWLIRARNPTTVDNRLLNRDQMAVLRPPRTAIVLGQGGWPIEVELLEV
jgi:hypothetical protein